MCRDPHDVRVFELMDMHRKVHWIQAKAHLQSMFQFFKVPEGYSKEIRDGGFEQYRNFKKDVETFIEKFEEDWQGYLE